MTTQFSELTLTVTKALSKHEKKEYGIFITPKSIVASLFATITSLLNHDMTSIKRVLEPSCGTCELIQYMDHLFTDVEIDGIEWNRHIYDAIQGMTFKNKVHIRHADFVQYDTDRLYDLIVGNPPYFVCKKADIPTKYESYIHGRPNIFGVFILHALSLLKPDGILALIVPNSFMNSVYYSKIRNHIKETCSILKIDDYRSLNDFMETEQATFGLILQKRASTTTSPTECAYSMRLNDHFVFTTDAVRLKDVFANATTLAQMGLSVRTGQIVWNQVKGELTDDTDHSILVYNTNISKDNKFEIKHFKNGEKKQYINRGGRIDPVLVVNRGNGNSDYKLNYAVIKTGPYLIENHLNEIYSPTKMKPSELLALYEKITRSFEHPNTQAFIDIFLGNNSLSKTELETIFPIYDI